MPLETRKLRSIRRNLVLPANIYFFDSLPPPPQAQDTEIYWDDLYGEIIRNFTMLLEIQRNVPETDCEAGLSVE